MSTINFESTVTALFKGMDGIISSKTIVGDAIRLDDTIVIPLMEVSFGMGAGAYAGEKDEKGAGGIGGKMSPSAMLVIQNGRSKIINVKSQDAVIRVLDLIPEVIDRIEMKKGKKISEEEIADIFENVENEEQ